MGVSDTSGDARGSDDCSEGGESAHLGKAENDPNWETPRAERYQVSRTLFSGPRETSAPAKVVISIANLEGRVHMAKMNLYSRIPIHCHEDKLGRQQKWIFQESQ